MPGRHKKRPARKTHARRKRGYVRRPATRSVYAPIPKPNMMGYVSGLPKTRLARMRYSENVSLTSTGGALDKVQFRANGVYDPNLTGVGHQPFGYDTWNTLYNHRVVVGSKIYVSFVGTGAVVSAAGVYLSDDTSVPYLTADGFIEAKKGTWAVMAGRETRAPTLQSSFSAKRYFNITDIKDNVDRLGASSTNNPTEQCYYNIWYQTQDSSTDTVYAQVIVDYIVMYSEPKDLAQS